MSTLTVDSLSKRYGRSADLALDNISFQLGSGMIAGILGHNGAGKSTLLGSIIGEVKATAGKIAYDTYDLTASPRTARRICSFMPQTYAPLTGVTPQEALSSVTGMRGLPDSTGERLVHEFMDELDIAEYARTPENKLSGGYHRLVSLGMAVVQQAQVLLLDEPTNDVDPIRRRMLWNLLRRVADNGALVLVVTHNLEEIQSVADRLLVFDRGHLLADSAPPDLAALSNTIRFEINGEYPVQLLSGLPVANITHTDSVTAFECDPNNKGQILSRLNQAFIDDDTFAFSVSHGTIQQAYEKLVGSEAL